MPRSWHSSTSYFSFRPTVLPQTSQMSPRASFGLPQRGQSTSCSPYGSAISVWPQLVQARQAAALTLPVADRVLDELQRGVFSKVADREHRLEHGLQPGVFALGRQPVHLQETLVGLLLDLDEVRDRNRRLDFREVDALAVDVLGKAVHACENL